MHVIILFTIAVIIKGIHYLRKKVILDKHQLNVYFVENDQTN